MKKEIKSSHDLNEITEACDRRIVKARHIISDLNDVINYTDGKVEIKSCKFDICDMYTALTVKFDLGGIDIGHFVRVIADKRNRLLINNMTPVNGFYTIFFDYNDDWN